ncbi:MAG: polymorphic toxin-type HINT domain-containing protein [Pirellulaceae bacterium]
MGVTETHPFWSVRDQAFVPIGKLSVGDEVITLHGEAKRITSILPRPGPAERVYNLEVNGEHTYFVGNQQLLVHNNGCTTIRLGVGEHIDDFGAELAENGIGSVRFGENRFFQIAENGRPKFSGQNGLAVQEKYVQEAIKHSEHIHFNLKGMSPEEFGKFMKGKSAKGYWTNMELKTIIDSNLMGKVTFHNGNIDDFLGILD